MGWPACRHRLLCASRVVVGRVSTIGPIGRGKHIESVPTRKVYLKDGDLGSVIVLNSIEGGKTGQIQVRSLALL